MGRKTTVINELKIFKKRASTSYDIEKMIFFGSRASGKPNKHSDVDLIIVSQKFTGLNFFKRGARMYDYWDYNYPVDFLCYTPREFSKLKRTSVMLKDAERNGIKI